jgi:hypothetical protein
MLMHASLTASIRIIGRPGISGTALLTSSFVLAAAWWVVVAAVTATHREQITRPPVYQKVRSVT